MLELSVGQKVCYPSQGVCLIEDIENKKIGDNIMQFYLLRILNNNSTIFVPVANAAAVGIRPIITPNQYKFLLADLAADFATVSDDWKTRSREYGDQLQSGDVFQAVDVLKKLTFLGCEKKLSFREQTLLEKAKFLIVSEVTNAGLAPAGKIEDKLNKLIENACNKHRVLQASVMTASH